MRCSVTTAVVCAGALIGGLFLGSSALGQAVPDNSDNPLAAHVLPAMSLGSSPIVNSTTLYPLNVPVFNSRPNAPATIYLDFDGDYTPNWGAYSPLTTPAYDIDGDPTTFSQEELSDINEICMRVAEAYSPFNINVTTIDPGQLVDRQSMRVVIGGDGTNETGNYWVGGRAGGVAYVGGFANFLDNTVYVFPKNLGNGVPKYVADAAAHEAGHSFGLQHQSLWPPTGGKIEYNTGNADEAPFMGTAYNATRGIWYVGPTITPNAIQDDVSVISNSENGFGYYWGNDAGDSIAQAQPLGDMPINTQFSVDGLITTIADKDFYSFGIDEDTVASFSVTGAPYGAMLDPDLALYDAVSGDLIELVNWGGLSESFNWVLHSGQYDIEVLSHGNVGDIGQYTLNGLFVGTIPEPACASMLLMLVLVRRTRFPR